jgi:hypothetical protein
VPPGFTITTEVCNLFYDLGRRVPEGLDGEMRDYMKKMEDALGGKFKFGDKGLYGTPAMAKAIQKSYVKAGKPFGKLKISLFFPFILFISYQPRKTGDLYVATERNRQRAYARYRAEDAEKRKEHCPECQPRERVQRAVRRPGKADELVEHTQP